MEHGLLIKSGDKLNIGWPVTIRPKKYTTVFIWRSKRQYELLVPRSYKGQNQRGAFNKKNSAGRALEGFKLIRHTHKQLGLRHLKSSHFFKPGDERLNASDSDAYWRSQFHPLRPFRSPFLTKKWIHMHISNVLFAQISWEFTVTGYRSVFIWHV